VITTVIFDMDGVVVDSEHLYQKAEERLFAEYGVTVPPGDWLLFRGRTEDQFYQLVKERYRLPDPIDVLRKKGRAYVLSVFKVELDYNEGFRALMARLKDHYHTGLVTSTAETIFEWMDRKLHLRTHFDKVIYSGMTVNSKPHPEPYLTMMNLLDVSPREAVIIEDSIVGLQSALASGAWTVAITGSVPVEEMPAAHALIHSLDEITPTFLGRLPTVSQQEVT